MGKKFDLEPRKVPEVKTQFREIHTRIPVPESIEFFKDLEESEPLSMCGMPPILWDRAEDFSVYDKWGNRWIDFTSAVLISNVGHSNPEVVEAIKAQADHHLLTSYLFANEPRYRLVKKMNELLPEPLSKTYLLTTGTESVECAVKLARTYGLKKSGGRKVKIVSFEDSFHGRTLASQMVGGIPSDKEWIVNLDQDMHQVPYPNGSLYDWADESNPHYSDEACFDRFLAELEAQEIQADQIAGVIAETHLGGWGGAMMPVGFAKKLRAFCDENDIVLIMDEMQAGFGRLGKLFGFMHYGIVPDLVCFGKALSGSLPLACVSGRADLMDIYGPASMTSTHSGNPVGCAAAAASLDYLVRNKLPEKCAELEPICLEYLTRLRDKYPDVIGYLNGKGLVWGLRIVKKGTKELDSEVPHEAARICVENGVMVYAPVGACSSTYKMSPPLTITEAALREGLEVFCGALEQAIIEAYGK